MTTNQTAIAPTQTWGHDSNTFTEKAPPEPWLQKLGLTPPSMTPAFFRVENTPQRVVIQNVRGFGQDGKGVSLKMKDKKTNVVTEKPATCYAEVLLLDPESFKTYVWQVLSRQTLANLYRLLQKAGPQSFGTLEVDIYGEGRGMDRQTFIIPAALAPKTPNPAAGDNAQDSDEVEG